MPACISPLTGKNLPGVGGTMPKGQSRGGLRDWNDVRFFLALAETGSQAAAARLLRTNQSTVCRRLRELEEQLDASLFDRHYRGMRLTPVGMQLIEQAREMESAVAQIDRRIAGFDHRMRGVVKISATEGVAAFWLTRHMVDFQRQYPGIVIEMLCDNEQLDLARREADIVIRLAQPKEPWLLARRVGTMRFALFASQGYLSTFGVPSHWGELGRHRLVDHTPYERFETWRALTDNHTGVVYRSNSSAACYQAVINGMGIGMFPTYNRIATPQLVQLDIPIDASRQIWLVSHEDTRDTARIRTVRDYIARCFAQDRRDWFPDVTAA